ncbi:MAG: DUF3732 domain-containing protein [Chloroflexi bacterium]|nr:DUF3732 domain-containing protein [Chloroflexota bacterium]
MEIVEYCLGKSEFPVSEGEVRKKVSWYGVVYQLDSTQVFIAKATPSSNRKSNSEAYIKVATEITIPSYTDLKPNTDDEGLLKTLSELIGIEPNISYSKEGQTPDSLEVSLNQSRFYLFQNQNTLASKEKLFQGKAEDYKYIAETIRNSLPYFLGAVPKEYFHLAHEHQLALKAYRAVSRKLKNAEAITDKEYGTAEKLFEEAKQVGLIDSSNASSTGEEILSTLKDLRNFDLASIISIGENRVDELQEELDAIRVQFHKNLRQLRYAESLETDTKTYYKEGTEQASRLASISIIENRDTSPSLCPLCASEVSTPTPSVESIKLSLVRLQKDLTHANRNGSQIAAQVFRLRKEQEELRQSIVDKESIIRNLISQRSDTQQLRDSGIKAAVVIGKIILYLDTLDLSDENATLRRQVAELEGKINRLEEVIKSFDVNDSVAAKLDVISEDMRAWAMLLNLEYKGSQYRFDLKNLTVVANENGKYIPMDKMGGGENWLGCHLIVFLAFHKYFIEHNRPVPRFIMLDQPTQVYFPDEKYKAWQGDPNEIEGDDRKIVNQLYEFLFNICETLFPNLQLIVTDHANIDTPRFQSALAEDPWRGGRALVPNNWPTKEEFEKQKNNNGQMSMFDFTEL